MKKAVFIGAVVLLLAGAASWWRQGHSRSVEPGTLELYGNVEIREVALGFRVAGRLAAVLHDEGDAVRAGEVLARLDDGPYRREVEEARARVASARAHVQLLEAGHRPQEIAQVRALAREREVTSTNAERAYRRQEELLAGRTTSIQDRDEAEARYREAEARLKSAREQLNLMEAGFRPEEISQARAELARAEAALGAAELRLADTVLQAPAEGVVFTRVQEPGAVLQPGTTVLTLSLQRPVWVRLYVHEPDLGRIRPGAKVEIHCDSRPGRPYTGQVGHISPRAEFTPKNVETAELRTSLIYRVRVVVNDSDDGLRQGMPVTARLVLQ